MLGLLALMVLTLIVMLIMRQGWKRILIVFVGFLVVIGIFNTYVTKTCGPNAKDVEIMTPQAEAISNYIHKNGIPESLAKIPNLPYPLKSCKRSSHKYEECIFYMNTNKYNITTAILPNFFNVRLVNLESATGINTDLIYDEQNKTWSLEKNNIAYSNRNKSFCSLKQ